MNKKIKLGESVWSPVRNFSCDFVWDSVWRYVEDHVWESVRDSVFVWNWWGLIIHSVNNSINDK